MFFKSKDLFIKRVDSVAIYWQKTIDWLKDDLKVSSEGGHQMEDWVRFSSTLEMLHLFIRVHIKMVSQQSDPRQTSLCSFCRAIWLLPTTFVILHPRIAAWLLYLDDVLGRPFPVFLVGWSGHQISLNVTFAVKLSTTKSWCIVFFFCQWQH